MQPHFSERSIKSLCLLVPERRASPHPGEKGLLIDGGPAGQFGQVEKRSKLLEIVYGHGVRAQKKYGLQEPWTILMRNGRESLLEFLDLDVAKPDRSACVLALQPNAAFRGQFRKRSAQPARNLRAVRVGFG